MWLCFLIVGLSHGAIAQEIQKFQIGPHISLVKPFGEHEIKESNNETTYLASSQRRWGIELGVDAFYALDSNYRIAVGMGYQDIAHGFILDSEEPNGLLEFTDIRERTDFYYFSIGVQRKVWTQGLYNLSLDLRYRSTFSSFAGNERGMNRVVIGGENESPPVNIWAIRRLNDGRPNGLMLSLQSAVMLQHGQELGFTISYFNSLRSEPLLEGEINYYGPGKLERDVLDTEASSSDFQGLINEFRSREAPDVRSTFSSKFNQFRFRFFYLF